MLLVGKEEKDFVLNVEKEREKLYIIKNIKMVKSKRKLNISFFK
jgi:hypothetical protein